MKLGTVIAIASAVGAVVALGSVIFFKKRQMDFFDWEDDFDEFDDLYDLDDYIEKPIKQTTNTCCGGEAAPEPVSNPFDSVSDEFSAEIPSVDSVSDFDFENE